MLDQVWDPYFRRFPNQLTKRNRIATAYEDTLQTVVCLGKTHIGLDNHIWPFSVARHLYGS